MIEAAGIVHKLGLSLRRGKSMLREPGPPTVVARSPQGKLSVVGTIKGSAVLARLKVRCSTTIVPSKLIIWPNENHWILNGEDSRFFYQEVRDWLQRWINGPSPTGMSASR